MKILYGVQGTGNGHLTRARLMQAAFAARGASVDWVFSGRAADGYFDMQAFGNYRTFKGLTFAVAKGRVNYPRSLWNSDLKQLYRDTRALDVSQYDLLINDFEPITAWAARRAGLPSVGISHQCAFRYPVPRATMHAGIRGFMRYFAPVDSAIGLHWHHYDHPILPPMVAPEMTPEKMPYGGYLPVTRNAPILVYLPFAEEREVLATLNRVPEHQFDVYMPTLAPRIEGNVRLHAFSREGFHQHLLGCAGVICSAGFELPSEALQLGKRLMVMPVAGQSEQEANAVALAQLGRAQVITRLQDADINAWLSGPAPSPAGFPNVAGALVDWVLDGRREPVADLAQRLWQASA